MKKVLLVATVAFALFNASAKAQTPTAFNWSGFYIGANLGSMNSKIEGSLPNHSFPNTWDVDLGNRWFYGGHAGIQQQWGNIVAGLEAAYSANNSGVETVPSGTPSCNNGAPPCQGTWKELFQVGGRLGWASGTWLFYGLGGWADAKLTTQSGGPPAFEVIGPAWYGGWYYGGGIEVALRNDVTVGIEYQHLDISSKTRVTDGGIGGPTFGVRSVGADGDEVRARLTFKFGP